MELSDWARQWGIPEAALSDLACRLGAVTEPLFSEGGSEAAAQARVRLEVSKLGWRVWRNNVGALRSETGQMVRYGLANDSARINAAVKSSDLIGLRPVLIGPEHLGATIGQFVAIECKAPGWRFRGLPRETAQLAFLKLVSALGGHATFATGAETVRNRP